MPPALCAQASLLLVSPVPWAAQGQASSGDIGSSSDPIGAPAAPSSPAIAPSPRGQRGAQMQGRAWAGSGLPPFRVQDRTLSLLEFRTREPSRCAAQCTRRGPGRPCAGAGASAGVWAAETNSENAAPLGPAPRVRAQLSASTLGGGGRAGNLIWAIWA